MERIERLLLDYATWKDPDFGQALRVRMKIPVQPWPGSDRRAQGAAAKPDQQQKSEDFEFLDDLTK